MSELRDENNLFFEKIKVIISNNTSRVDIITRERGAMQEQINEIKDTTVEYLGKVALQKDLAKFTKETSENCMKLRADVENMEDKRNYVAPNTLSSSFEQRV